MLTTGQDEIGSPRIHSGMLWLAHEIAAMPEGRDHLHLSLPRLRASQIRAIHEHAKHNRISVAEPNPGEVFILPSPAIYEWRYENLKSEEEQESEDDAPPLEIVVELSRLEGAVFTVLWSRGRITKQELQDAIWKDPVSPETVDKTLRRLRKKLEKFSFPYVIDTKSGVVSMDR